MEGSKSKPTIERLLVKLSCSAGEPHGILHSGRCPFGEQEYLVLEVDEEGIGPPPPNEIDGTTRDTGLVQCRGPNRTERMVSNVMGVKPQLKEIGVFRTQVEESHNIWAGDQPAKDCS